MILSSCRHVRKIYGAARCIALLLAFAILLITRFFSSPVNGADRAALPCDPYPFIIQDLESGAQSGNRLDILRLQGLADSCTYPELAASYEATSSTGHAVLRTVIEQTMERKARAGFHLFIEDTIIDHKPYPFPCNFYVSVPPEQYYIYRLDPGAENVYFENPRLKYSERGLEKKGEFLWRGKKDARIGRGAKKTERREPSFMSEDPPVPVKGWRIRLEDTMLTNHILGYRQWLKTYAEDRTFPLIHEETLLMRDEYRLFCLDLSTGEELWQFPEEDDNGYSFSQNFRHPHVNSYGNEMLLDKDTVYTELDGSLTAISLEGSGRPRLIWKKSLGEYTLCTVPVVSGKVLTAGLINSKGEIWACGYDLGTGRMIWNTYIGSSFYLSPVCTISEESGGYLFLATNHGVLVCLASSSGSIAWIRKYRAAGYSLTEYFLAQIYKKNFTSEPTIPYDTQFLRLEPSGSKLYYKPRESEHLYILDPQNGDLIDSLYMSRDKGRILAAEENRIVTLSSMDDAPEKSLLEVTELDTAELTASHVIDARPDALEGVTFSGRGKAMIKIGRRILVMDFLRQGPVYAWLDIQEDGLLVFGGSGRFFLEDQGHLQSYVLKDDKEPGRETENRKLLERKRYLLRNLVMLAEGSPSNAQGPSSPGQLMEYLSDELCPAQDIADIIGKDPAPFREDAWKTFISRLSALAGERVIKYRGIFLRLRAFLSGEGLLPLSGGEETGAGPAMNKQPAEPYHLRNSYMTLLPIKLIKGSGLPDRYLVYKMNQLICIREDGTIAWARKVFHNNTFDGGVKTNVFDRDWHMRAYRDLTEAFLYNRTLIINDRVNAIGYDIDTGRFLWSLTLGDEELRPVKIYPRDKDKDLLDTAGIDLEYIEKARIFSYFEGGSLFLIRGGTIYRVDPETGYCSGSFKTAIPGPVDIKSADGNISLLSFLLDRIVSVDLDLTRERVLSTGIESSRNRAAFFFIAGGHMIIETEDRTYALDRRTGARVPFPEETTGYLDMSILIDSGCIATVGYKKTACYMDDGSGKSIIQKWLFDTPGRHILHKFSFGRDGLISTVFEKDGGYLLGTIDVQTGKELYHIPLDFLNGMDHDSILDISTSFDSSGDLLFAWMTLSQRQNGELVCDNLMTHMAVFDYNKGVMLSHMRYPDMPIYSYFPSKTTETVNYFISVFHSILLDTRVKSDE